MFTGIRFDVIHERDGRTGGHCMTAKTALASHRAVKTILKARVAAGTGSQYVYVGFSRRNKIPCCSAYTISEKAMRFRHPDYNADRTEKLISCPCPEICRHATFHANPCTRFFSNLANRQTDKRTRAKTCTCSFVGGNNKKCGRRVRPTRYAPARL